MKLVDRISKDMLNHFDDWEVTEQIFDDKKAFWCIKKPNSEYQKVCLYRDGCNMFVYGDYGQFTFDSMTWLGSVHNLQYDNLGYQMEKLDRDSKSTLYIYDESQCKKDIYAWLKERLKERYDIEEGVISEIISWFKENSSIYIMDCEIEELCEKYKVPELEDILNFVREALENVDEYEWISFLRRTSFQEFDEECESDLWQAGRCIHQRYFICMYALMKCSEKLLKKEV